MIYIYSCNNKGAVTEVSVSKILQKNTQIHRLRMFLEWFLAIIAHIFVQVTGVEPTVT
jgi:hypothetical protein